MSLYEDTFSLLSGSNVVLLHISAQEYSEKENPSQPQSLIKG